MQGIKRTCLKYGMPITLFNYFIIENYDKGTGEQSIRVQTRPR